MGLIDISAMSMRDQNAVATVAPIAPIAPATTGKKIPNSAKMRNIVRTIVANNPDVVQYSELSDMAISEIQKTEIWKEWNTTWNQVKTTLTGGRTKYQNISKAYLEPTME